VTDPLGQVTSYTYADHNDVTAIGYSGAVNTTGGVSFGYDSVFNGLTSMADATGTISFTYNPVVTGTTGSGLLASVTGPLANSSVMEGLRCLFARNGMDSNPFIRFGETHYPSGFAPCTKSAGREIEVARPFGDAMADSHQVLRVTNRLIDRSPVYNWSQIDLDHLAIRECKTETVSTQGLRRTQFLGEVIHHSSGSILAGIRPLFAQRPLIPKLHLDRARCLYHLPFGIDQPEAVDGVGDGD